MDEGILNHEGGRRLSLVMLAGVMLILGGAAARFFMGGPAAATAVEQSRASEAGDAGPNPLRVERATLAPWWNGVPQRDLFHSEMVFPPPVEEVAPPPPPPVEEVAPPPPPPSVDRAALAEEARRAIVLNGTVVGDRPLAIINGKTYRIGQSVGGFVITKIGPRSIVVERESVLLIITSD